MSKYDSKKISQGFLYTIAIVVAIYETWTLVNKTDGDTISATLQGLGDNQTFIPFMDGMLAGHLWKTPKSRAAHICGEICGFLFWPLLDGQQVAEGAVETIKELREKQEEKNND